jgi:hypothetical protein
VAQHSILDVFRFKSLAKQRVSLKIDHSYSKVVAGTPEGMRFPRFIIIQRRSLDRRPCDTVTG